MPKSLFRGSRGFSEPLRYDDPGEIVQVQRGEVQLEEEEPPLQSPPIPPTPPKITYLESIPKLPEVPDQVTNPENNRAQDAIPTASPPELGCPYFYLIDESELPPGFKRSLNIKTSRMLRTKTTTRTKHISTAPPARTTQHPIDTLLLPGSHKAMITMEIQSLGKISVPVTDTLTVDQLAELYSRSEQSAAPCPTRSDEAVVALRRTVREMSDFGVPEISKRHRIKPIPGFWSQNIAVGLGIAANLPPALGQGRLEEVMEAAVPESLDLAVIDSKRREEICLRKTGSLSKSLLEQLSVKKIVMSSPEKTVEVLQGFQTQPLLSIQTLSEELQGMHDVTLELKEDGMFESSESVIIQKSPSILFAADFALRSQDERQSTSLPAPTHRARLQPIAPEKSLQKMMKKSVLSSGGLKVQKMLPVVSPSFQDITGEAFEYSQLDAILGMRHDFDLPGSGKKSRKFSGNHWDLLKKHSADVLNKFAGLRNLLSSVKEHQIDYHTPASTSRGDQLTMVNSLLKFIPVKRKQAEIKDQLIQPRRKRRLVQQGIKLRKAPDLGNSSSKDIELMLELQSAAEHRPNAKPNPPPDQLFAWPTPAGPLQKNRSSQPTGAPRELRPDTQNTRPETTRSKIARPKGFLCTGGVIELSRRLLENRSVLWLPAPTSCTSILIMLINASSASDGQGSSLVMFSKPLQYLLHELAELIHSYFPPGLAAVLAEDYDDQLTPHNRIIVCSSDYIPNANNLDFVACVTRPKGDMEELSRMETVAENASTFLWVMETANPIPTSATKVEPQVRFDNFVDQAIVVPSSASKMKQNVRSY